MDRTSEPRSNPKQQQLQELVRQLQDAWTKSADVDLRRFLPPTDDPLYRDALVALVKADLRIRWQRRRGKPLESYVERFPELGSVESLDTDMLLEEYRARAQYGEPPELNSYRERFPRQFAAFEAVARENPTQTGTEETRALPSGPPPPPSPSAGETATSARTLQTVGDYKMLQRLGRGSFAEVWQGVAPGGFPVAIKRIMRPLEDDEAQRELESLKRVSQLRHPFLLQTHTSFMVDNHLWVVMELADGTLRDRQKACAKTGGLIPLPELMCYFRESAEVLDYMHGQHLMHRDIKPQNILLLHGHAKVADFGLALIQESQRALFTATSSGTPAYMAPEVWRGKVSQSSDQYSLAFAYAEQRLGRLPFDARDIAGLMTAHLTGIPDLTGLPAPEQTVLLRGLAKDPAQRFPSCQDFVRALEQSLRDELHRADPKRHGGLRVEPHDSSDLSRTLSPSQGGQGARSATEPMGGRPRPAWSPPPKRSHRPWLVAALLAMVLLGVAGWFGVNQFRPTYSLEVDSRLTLRPGESKSLPLRIRRNRFDDEVRLSWVGLPADCQASEVTIPAGQSSADLPIEVAPNAALGAKTLTLKATSVAGEQKSEVELLVEGSPLYKLPSGVNIPQGAKLKTVEGVAYYDRIEVIRDGIHVPFLLMAKTGDQGPATFYIMEDKVWVGLYRKYADYAAKSGERPQSDRWLKEIENHEDVEQWPVLGVYPGDADRCAEWLGGQLPLPDQWDKAAGYYLKKSPGPYESPFVPKEDIAIQRKTPLPCGEGKKDVSLLGCRDMAGNGIEWTGARFEDWQPPELKRSTRAALDSGDFIVVRSKHYAEREPYKWGDAVEGGALPGKPVEKGSVVGFRVVIVPEMIH